MMRETKLLPSFVVFAAPVAFAAIAIAALTPSRADASVSVALSVDDVAKTSTIVARVVPRAQTSAWENGRIVTTTRLAVERVLGAAPTSVPPEIDVRTLGGMVGDVGQSVEGEARFSAGSPSIVFLVPRASDGALFVNGRAQGQLVVARAKDGHEIVRVTNTGAIVANKRPREMVSSTLVTALDGRDADDATREVARAWERTHAQ